MSRPPILVVDDAPVNLNLMRLFFKHDGYDVRTSGSAEDALEQLSTYRPELVLANIQLPGMNGLELTRKIKENPRTSMIRVVALTASGGGDKEDAFGAGCDDYIAKPIDMASLSARVRIVLSRAAVSRPSPKQPAPDIFSDVDVESLRRRFLESATAHCRQLLASLDSDFDARAAGPLHQWIGSAALLGHPEISRWARAAEDAMQAKPPDVALIRDAITTLYRALEDVRESDIGPLLQNVTPVTAGRRIALAGFAIQFADTLCAALDDAQARPLLFAISDDPESDAVCECDLVIVHVRPETLGSAWLGTANPALATGKLVLAGERSHLMALAPEIRSRAAELLVEPVKRAETLMRLALIFSRHEQPLAAPSRAAAARPDNPIPIAARTRVSRPTVVLADDDEIVLTMVKSTLANFGVSCRSVDNGADALELIRTERPHAAVLDVNMPGMDGFRVLAAAQAEKLSTPIILLTARRQEKDVIRAFELGADDYISKPFNPFELVARLKRLWR